MDFLLGRAKAEWRRLRAVRWSWGSDPELRLSGPLSPEEKAKGEEAQDMFDETSMAGCKGLSCRRRQPPSGSKNYTVCRISR